MPQAFSCNCIGTLKKINVAKYFVAKCGATKYRATIIVTQDLKIKYGATKVVAQR